MTRNSMWGNRKPVLMFLVAFVLLIGGIGSWSVGVEIAGAVLGRGNVEVKSNQVAIQHPTGGVVQAIAARNGDFVREGDLLLQLDGSVLRTELNIVEGELIETLAKEARFDAILEEAQELTLDGLLVERGSADLIVHKTVARQRRLLGAAYREDARKTDLLIRKIAQIKEQIAAVDAQIEAVREQSGFLRNDLANARRLEKQGLVKAAHHNAIRRDSARMRGEMGRLLANRAELAEKTIELELEQLAIVETRRSAAAEELSKLQPARIKLIESRADLLTRLDQLDVRAGVAGHVHESQVAGRRSVIEAGKPIMWIVPTDQPIVAVVRIDASDIEQVHQGQDTMLRFSAFNRRATPLIAGRVLTVSADAILEPTSQSRYYEVRVAFASEDLARHAGTEALPGMPVEAYFATRGQTPFDYVTRPLVDYFRHAYRDT